MKKDKKIIYFCKPFGRVQADSLDTYNWLFLYDKKLAERFKKKAKSAERKLDKTQKEMEIENEFPKIEKWSYKFNTGSDDLTFQEAPLKLPLLQRIKNYIAPKNK